MDDDTHKPVEKETSINTGVELCSSPVDEDQMESNADNMRDVEIASIELEETIVSKVESFSEGAPRVENSIQVPSQEPKMDELSIKGLGSKIQEIIDTSLADEKADENVASDLGHAKADLLKSLALESTENSPVECAIDTENSIEETIKTELLAAFELEKGNFFKGCKWAPDGLCLITNSDDNTIRLYNTPDAILSNNWDATSKIEVCLKFKEAETIYDYTWWPQMNSMYPATCCLATTSKDQPIHLWDAFNGDLRASYIAKNSVDEIAAAHSIAFSPDGLQMICGFPKELRLFYIDRPGDQCEKWLARKHKRATGQRGILSTLEFHPDGSSVACGSYDGTVAIYSTKNGELTSIFNAKNKGVTQVKFSSDGNRLYTGSRKDNSIVCWDVRYLNGDLFHLERTVETNQRIYFDLVSELSSNEGLRMESKVVSGGTDGFVLSWDVSSVSASDVSQNIVIEPIYKFQSDRDCTNGVHAHPYLPVLATSSGQRHYGDFSDSESEGESHEIEENTLKLWHVSGLRDSRLHEQSTIASQ